MARVIQIAILVAVVVVCIVAAEELYSDKYDNIDPMTILNNDRLRNQYYLCLSGKGPCVTDDAKFIKKHMVEALVTKCTKCTEKQKELYNVVTKWYTEHEPEKLQEIVAMVMKEAKEKNIGN